MEKYDLNLNKYVGKIIDSQLDVVGEIYLITNIANGMQYVGQTKSHRLNHGRYRPFGYQSRFADHCSQARTNNQKSTYILNAIRKYGDQSFKTELVCRCDVNEMDTLEEKYIIKFNTLYPNGYNLTTGGKTTIFVQARIKDDVVDYTYTKGYRKVQSEVTRKRISQALKDAIAKEDVHEKYQMTAKEQHMRNRMSLFKDCMIDISKLETYIRSKMQGGRRKFIVQVDDISTTFYSKYESEEQVKQRAIEFLKSLSQQHDQIAGTP